MRKRYLVLGASLILAIALAVAALDGPNNPTALLTEAEERPRSPRIAAADSVALREQASRWAASKALLRSR